MTQVDDDGSNCRDISGQIRGWGKQIGILKKKQRTTNYVVTSYANEHDNIVNKRGIHKIIFLF